MSEIMIDISIIVPIYNEEGNLQELYKRLTHVLEEQLRITYEIILVDDGSKDRSWLLINELHTRNSNVKGIKFSRNFGHHIAITAGMDIAKGKAVILMDGDLQDQPEEIPKLYQKFLEGFDVVYGVRQERKHSFLKIMTSKIFILLINRIVGSEVPINSHIFRIMNRKVVNTLNQFRERDRFITGLISFIGFKQIGVEIQHGQRYAGKTKYTLFKLLKLAMNTVTSFSYKPLQLASLLGIIISCLSFLGVIYLVIKKFFCGVSIIGWTSTVVIILFIGGIQMLFLGVLGEYVGRIYAESQNRPLYVIKETLP